MKKIKIGLFLEDSKISNKDFSDIICGNPGVGGTEYEIVLLGYMLAKDVDYDVTVYHYNITNSMPQGVNSVICTEESLFENYSGDVLIFRNGKCNEWYKRIKQYSINCICWAHNFMTYNELCYAADNEFVKRIICCGRQEYDAYFDHRAINKMVKIDNMFSTKNKEKRSDNFKEEVTYTGCLTKAKGFHILAKYWKQIIQSVPNAHLNVIGSASLYNSSEQLGEYEIAERTYEKEFMEYLTDEIGNILPSVTFYGVMGTEKKDIYRRTSVGVENPSAITETFGISGVEMLEMGIPIVTKAENGFLDTIPNRKAGLLFEKENELPNLIIKLLKDRELNVAYGNYGVQYVKRYTPEYLIKEWKVCINDILNGSKVKVKTPTEFLNKNHKRMRITIYFLHEIKIFKWIPSLYAINDFKNNVRGRIKLLCFK